MAPLKVAVYIYPQADVLDFSGPTEIYSMAPMDGPADFTVTSFAHHNPVSAGSGALNYVPNVSFADMAATIADYDILVVPGAMPDTIQELVATPEGKETLALLRKFVTLPPRPEAGSRILQSVCTGSLILAAAGVMAGRKSTTHHIALEILKNMADAAADGGESGIQVVRERWVDAGKTEAGVRIVNAAGVSSGIDTSLWIIEELLGKEKSDYVAEVAEFERRSAAWKA
jgi:transcriptional regulator GlxA family with amidase domain